MGYTNYWYQTRAFTDKEWYEIKTYLLFRLTSFELDDLDKEIKISILDDEVIQFSGKNDKLSCEHFTLHKNIRKPLYLDDNVEFNFCKTFKCPPYPSLYETPVEIIDDFFIIDHEYNHCIDQERQEKKNA